MSAEDAVINSIVGQYANNSLYESGRPEWPNNCLKHFEKACWYSTDNQDADVDAEWTCH